MKNEDSQQFLSIISKDQEIVMDKFKKYSTQDRIEEVHGDDFSSNEEEKLDLEQQQIAAVN